MKLITFVVSAVILCSAQGEGLRRGLLWNQQQKHYQQHQQQQHQQQRLHNGGGGGGGGCHGGAAGGCGGGGGGGGGVGGAGNLFINSPSTLTTDEIEVLKYMREEEKSARDLYRAFNEKWKIRVFDNIANSEQHHMDMVLSMLELNGIDDPVDGRAAGKFQNQTIQEMYNKLESRGLDTSVTEALKVGAYFEELDIKDLMEQKPAAPELQVLYGRLLRASENHFRAFVRVLDSSGESYVPEVLDDDDVAAILGL